MRTTVVGVSVPIDLLLEVDEFRGDTPRSHVIVKALKDLLKREGGRGDSG